MNFEGQPDCGGSGEHVLELAGAGFAVFVPTESGFSLLGRAGGKHRAASLSSGRRVAPIEKRLLLLRTSCVVQSLQRFEFMTALPFCFSHSRLAFRVH